MQITAQVKDTGPAMLLDFSDGARAVVGSFPDGAELVGFIALYDVHSRFAGAALFNELELEMVGIADAAADALKTITGGEDYAPALHAAIEELEELSAEKAAARFFMND